MDASFLKTTLVGDGKTLKLFVFLFFVSGILYSQQTPIIGGTKGLGLDKSNSVIQQENNFSCDPLPLPQNPAQMKGAEGVPPLPLPAVPLRRSEKNNPPRPPVLIGKIDSGKGESDWNTNPADVENLLKWMAKEMNVSFSWKVVKLENIIEEKKLAQNNERP